MAGVNQYSFLLGAGFSKPAGYPLAAELNQVFSRLTEDQFTLFTNGVAQFHDGQPHANDWFMRREERLFAERLISRYCEKVCGDTTHFHYERFYDWYKDLRSGRSQDSDIITLATDLNLEPHRAIMNFDLTFNQLLADRLRKWYPRVSFGQGLPDSHARFLDLVERLAHLDSILHFHSLNHDLFFENLSMTHAMQRKLSDGFVECGSSYYGQLSVPLKDGGAYSYTVRLPVFRNQFDSQFRLYKLHGSVDHYSCASETSSTVTIKIRRGIGLTELFRESNATDTPAYERIGGLYHPDFLCGTTYKTRQYDATPYYTAMLNHFQNNLRNSRALIVIGYGWGDLEINRIIDAHSPTIPPIVDINLRPVSAYERRKQRVRFHGGGVKHFDPTKVLEDVRGS